MVDIPIDFSGGSGFPAAMNAAGSMIVAKSHSHVLLTCRLHQNLMKFHTFRVVLNFRISEPLKPQEASEP
jgi:hypothetical protein